MVVFNLRSALRLSAGPTFGASGQEMSLRLYNNCLFPHSNRDMSLFMNCWRRKQDALFRQHSRGFFMTVPLHAKKKDPPSHLSKYIRLKTPTAIDDLAKAKKAAQVEVWRNMTIKDFAENLGRKPGEVLTVLHNYVTGGKFLKKSSDLISNDMVIVEVCKFYKKSAVFVSNRKEIIDDINKDAFPRPPADSDCLVRRPPVVTIMGHVDHGKTTLLDYLRKAHVAANEFGGITQHIGAFSVKVGDNDRITFIDTPGHAAFTAMRSRGAHATDIVVLVVAADDGVMEQTIESIRMANEAKVPILVAINKIDKTQADIRQIEEKLARYGVMTESMGGDVQAIPISALQGTNISTLVDAILLQAELMDLKADPEGLVEGIVLESKQDPHRGKIASAIIHRGTLRKGAVLVAGCAHAKVRLMFDESGQQISQAPPSTPVEMMGWRELPFSGDVILEVESEQRASQVVKLREGLKHQERDISDDQEAQKKAAEAYNKYRESRMASLARGYIRRRERYQLETETKDTTPKVSVIIKGDVVGSVEAILDVVETYHGKDVLLDLVHYGVGDITPTDIELATTFNSIIYGFNVKTTKAASDLSHQSKVVIRYVNVIYKLIDDLKNELQSNAPYYDAEEISGEGDVLQQFQVNERRKKLFVAGVKVRKGSIIKEHKVRLLRKDEVVYDGHMEALRHVKNEVSSMKAGSECGIMLGDPLVQVLPGDEIVSYKLVQKRLKLEWDPGF